LTHPNAKQIVKANPQSASRRIVFLWVPAMVAMPNSMLLAAPSGQTFFDMPDEVAAARTVLRREHADAVADEITAANNSTRRVAHPHQPPNL